MLAQIVDRSSSWPSSTACWLLDQRVGDRVVGEGELRPGRVEGVGWDRSPPVIFGDVVADELLGVVGVLGDVVVGLDLTLEQVVDQVGVVLQEVVVDQQVGGDELAAPATGRPRRRARVPPSETRMRGVRLGEPCAVDLALLELADGVSCCPG